MTGGHAGSENAEVVVEGAVADDLRDAESGDNTRNNLSTMHLLPRQPGRSIRRSFPYSS